LKILKPAKTLLRQTQFMDKIQEKIIFGIKARWSFLRETAS
jgi:hypothetical protein